MSKIHVELAACNETGAFFVSSDQQVRARQSDEYSNS